MPNRLHFSAISRAKANGPALRRTRIPLTIDMGPINLALLQLFRVDSDLRKAQDDLDQATRGLRIQKKRAELGEQALTATGEQLKQVKAKQMELDSDLKQRDEHIEHLRLQQQEAQNNRQYQAFLGEINTQKVERGRIEDESTAKLQEIDALTAQRQEQADTAKAERAQAEELESSIGDTTAALQARIDELQPVRDEAAGKVPAGPRAAFERLADNYDGEALAPIGHIEGKEERYYCTACNMELVVDVYNRLRTRDDVVTCPGCGRMLFIPEDLTPEIAVKQKKVAKRATRSTAKKTTKKAAKKTKKGVPADLKRVVTTAAAESLREAELEERKPVECEVRVKGVDDPVGPFSVSSRDGFAKLLAGKVQAADIDTAYEVVLVGESPNGDTIVAPPITEVTDAIDGAAGSPDTGVAHQVPIQPTVAATADEAVEVEAKD